MNETQATSSKLNKKVIGAIVAAGIMSFCGVVVETAMNITFPTLMDQFGVNTSTVQWMTTIYLLVVAIIVPISSFLKKRFNTKTLFIVANLLFIVGLTLDGTAQSFTLLLIGRLIQGIGTGIALPLMFNIILEQVPLSKIGMMMGIGTLITAAAPAVGPTFGGIVVSTLGWRYIFIFLIPILVISLILGITCIQQKRPTEKVSFDTLSMVGIVLMFGGLILGFSNMGSQSFLTFGVLGAFLIGIIGTIGFIYRSLHIDNPIIHLDVFKNSKFNGHVVSLFLLQLSLLGLSFILPNYMQITNGTSASIAGIILLPGALIGAVMAPLGGRLLDKSGPTKPLLTAAGLGLLAMIVFVIFGMSLNNILIGFAYTFFMICIGLSFGNLMTNGLKQLPKELSTDGNAVFTTAQQFAGATGTSIAAAIVAQGQVGLSKAHGMAVGSEHALIFLLVLFVVEIIVISKTLLTPKKETVESLEKATIDD